MVWRTFQLIVVDFLNIMFSIDKLVARQSQAFRTSTTGNETDLEI